MSNDDVKTRRASEERLDAIREEAALRATTTAEGVRPAGAPFPIADAERGYYGQPLLKPPVWTWEVPAYFFVGGAAGAAAVIAAFASARGREELARDARWIAAAGAALSPPLLISDLGRHARFLGMLRVFKLQSPMSVGAWTLLAFSHATAAAAFADVAKRRLGGGVPVQLLSDASDALAAATGVVMASYTGVLIGATAIPVWSHNVAILPVHFAASSVGAAASALELAGHRDRALHWIAAASALVETAVGASIEGRGDPALEPLKHGRTGTLVRAGGLLSGPVPLLLRLLGGRSVTARRFAAVSAIAGSAITRWGWLQAGRESSRV
ncbi:MAG TPA: NrfD/PsrC family molybdoenzyme membrane anchor subunit [Vicinamibacterales bacterium]|nr:NrfD/PsrC family molybdoenzyme membrane anchor subunit [Vicinamibacterales bacterium]